MRKNNSNFSMDEIRQMAQSDAGKQLMAILQQSHSATAEAIRASAKSGDMAQVQQAMQAFLSDPKARALLRQLEEDHHG